MALRRNESIQITPWYNKDEFLRVKEALFSNDIQDNVWGLQKLEVWRQRSYPTLPAAIEATASLIRANVEDKMTENGMCPVGDNRGLTLIYAAAVTQFVNHMTELGQFKITPVCMKKAASNIGFPDWIVDLRHQVTHAGYPSLEILKKGATYIYSWLLDNYWDPMCSKVQPPLRIPKSTEEEDDDKEVYEKIIREFKGIQCELARVSMTSQNRLSSKRNICLNYIESRLSKKKRSKFLQCLVKMGGFFISMAEMEIIFPESDIEMLINSESLDLPTSLVDFWAPLIALINNTRSMQAFVHQLLITHLSLEKIHQKIACSWVYKIIQIAATNGASEMSTDPLITIFGKQPWLLNWLECTTDCVFNASIYSAPIFQEAIEHVHPPYTELKKAQITTMFSIFIGCIPPSFEHHLKQRSHPTSPYTWEQLQENVDLIGCAGTSSTVTVSKIIWRRTPNNINWSELPIGHVFGSVDNFINYPPTKRNTSEILSKQKKNELTDASSSNQVIHVQSLLDADGEIDEEYIGGNFDIEMNAAEDMSVSVVDFF